MEVKTAKCLHENRMALSLPGRRIDPTYSGGVAGGLDATNNPGDVTQVDYVIGTASRDLPNAIVLGELADGMVRKRTREDNPEAGYLTTEIIPLQPDVGGTGLSTVGAEDTVLTIVSGEPAWVPAAYPPGHETTGTGKYVLQDGATINTAILTSVALGAPTSGTLTSCTGLPVSTGLVGLGTGIATFLGTNVGGTDANRQVAQANGTSLTYQNPWYGTMSRNGINYPVYTYATTLTLTQADIVGMTSTAIYGTYIPAPGAGFMVLPCQVITRFVRTTTSLYGSTGNLALYYGAAGTVGTLALTVLTSGLLGGNLSATYSQSQGNISTQGTSTQAVDTAYNNQPLGFRLITGGPITNLSGLTGATITVALTYSIFRIDP